MFDPLDPNESLVPTPKGWPAGFKQTVPNKLVEQASTAFTMDFAVSYLCGAVLTGDVLQPRTETARRKILDSKIHRKFFEEIGIKIWQAIPLEHRVPLEEICPEAGRFTDKGKRQRV